MNRREFACKIENRVFDMDVRDTDVKSACYEALYHGFSSVQVFPVMVDECRKILKDTEVKIAVLIDYCHGGFPPELKAFEIEDAKIHGADIFNVCITIRNVKDQKWEKVDKELDILRNAAGEKELRIFLETEYLTDEEIEQLCLHAKQKNIDTLITSTGLYYKLDKNTKTEVPVKASLDDIRLIKKTVGNSMKILAQGFIDDYKFAKEVFDAGADMIGSAKAENILDGFEEEMLCMTER